MQLKSPIWNIGQLSKNEIKELEKKVKLGEMKKERKSWMGISSPKTVYTAIEENER